MCLSCFVLFEFVLLVLLNLVILELGGSGLRCSSFAGCFGFRYFGVCFGVSV